MRFLVTGATGFIGQNIIAALVKRGHEVIATGTSVQLRIDEMGIEWIPGDLLLSSDCERIVGAACAEGLIHTAWDTTPGSYWTSQNNLRWVSASLQLFDAFQRHGGRRIVFVGTSAEYSWLSEDSLCELQSKLAPSSLYGICKNSLREILESWAGEDRMSWAWGRVFCPFGPKEKPQRLIPKVIHRLVAGETVDFDSGALIRDFLHVEDLGDAFAALSESTIQGPINIASGRGVSIRELLTVIAKQVGRFDRLQFDTLPDPISEPKRIVANIRRLHEELDWKSERSLEQRLVETCDWWLAQPESKIKHSY